MRRFHVQVLELAAAALPRRVCGEVQRVPDLLRDVTTLTLTTGQLGDQAAESGRGRLKTISLEI